MATIFVEGLGEIEIQGDTPNAEEESAIADALGLSTDTETTDTPFVDTADVESGQDTDSIIPEMIDPNLAKVGRPQGLEKIGGRPTFEAAGAIAGSIPGTAVGPAGTVGGGVLGAMGGGQLYDILQSTITDEPTNFGIQTDRAVSDLKREALLQSFFAKVPGLFTSVKRGLFGKPDKELYESAKRANFPLSLSDSGNIIAKGYGRVIGVFPYIGNPIKQKAGEKAIFINKTADDTLNTFGPNVTLTKLGVDMTKASQKTYGEFRRITGFFYDDFYKAVDDVGNTPIISTKNFKNSLSKFVKLVEDGAIKGLDSPQKDALFKYAKQGNKVPNYINATQYKSLKEDIKVYAKLSQNPSEAFNIKILTGLKSALETDLRLLTKKSYQDDLLKNIYPLSKSKRQQLDPNLLSNVAEKLKFADKVYAQGLENSIITSSLKEMAKKEGVKLAPIPGKNIFDSIPAKEFKKIDKNIFKAGFERPGSITADQLGEKLLQRKLSPQLLNDLRTLIGEKQFTKFVRAKMQKGFDDSLIASSQKGQLMFDPYKFEKGLGLNTESGRDLMKVFLKDSKLTIEKLDDFFNIAKNHAGLKVPDVTSFVARRAILGGTKSIIGGVIGTAAVTSNPLIGVPLVYMARKTSRFLTNPNQLDNVMKVLDPNSPASQTKVAVLKLVDAMISDSQTKQEENEFKLMRETIELMPLNEIKKGFEDTLNSSQQFLMDQDFNLMEQDIDSEELILDDQSQIQTPPLQTPDIDANLLSTTSMQPATGINATGLTPTEQALLSPEEQNIRLRQRGMA